MTRCPVAVADQADRRARRRSIRRRACAGTACATLACNCSASRVPDVLDGLRDQVVERGEVVGRRRQRQAGATGDGAVPHGVEAAFAQQIGGRADQRVPPTFSLRGDCCRHALACCQQRRCGIGLSANHQAFLRETSAAHLAEQVYASDGMMARMPELSRRAILRLGVGAAAGAAGAYALGSAMHRAEHIRQRPPVAMTSAVRRWRRRRRWQPPPADAGPDIRRRFVRLGGPRRRSDQLGDRPSARPDRRRCDR